MNALRHGSNRKLPSLDRCIEPIDSPARDWFIGVARWICPFLRYRPPELQQAHQRVAKRMIERAETRAVVAPPPPGLPFADTLPMVSAGTWMRSPDDFLSGVEVTALDIDEIHADGQADSLHGPTEIHRQNDIESIQNEGK